HLVHGNIAEKAYLTRSLERCQYFFNFLDIALICIDRFGAAEEKKFPGNLRCLCDGLCHSLGEKNDAILACHASRAEHNQILILYAVGLPVHTDRFMEKLGIHPIWYVGDVAFRK